ncbi:hypothetical protein QE152_g7264 [Popillia japonica]|uniref:Uncharacterized protein n=1 Tax=Popillia japonica TaxID=7064 RepID=A0AAW1MHB1_POPJA
MDVDTVIDRIGFGLPENVREKIDRENLENITDLFSELKKHEGKIGKKNLKTKETKQEWRYKNEEKKPCNLVYQKIELKKHEGKIGKKNFKTKETKQEWRYKNEEKKPCKTCENLKPKNDQKQWARSHGPNVPEAGIVAEELVAEGKDLQWMDEEIRTSPAYKLQGDKLRTYQERKEGQSTKRKRMELRTYQERKEGQSTKRKRMESPGSSEGTCPTLPRQVDHQVDDITKVITRLTKKFHELRSYKNTKPMEVTTIRERTGNLALIANPNAPPVGDILEDIKQGFPEVLTLMEEKFEEGRVETAGIKVKTIKKTMKGDVMLEIHGGKEKAEVLKHEIMNKNSGTKVEKQKQHGVRVWH